jgi:hypothetical protein
MRTSHVLLTVCGLALGLSACSGDGGSTSPPPVVVKPPLEDKFGAGFGSAFRAGPNTAPAAVKAGDVNPVDPTAVPQSLK